MEQYYARHPSCHKRAVHEFGRQTTRLYDEAREGVRRHLRAPRKESIIFLRNTTEAINLVAHSLPLRSGDVVLTSDAEHNSNLLPWQFLRQAKGVLHRTFPIAPTADGLSLGEVEAELQRGNVKLLSVFYTSHVTGVSLPVRDLAALAHRYGARILVDAAQALPHRAINVIDLDCDFMAFSFHKAFGPTGMGGLYGKAQCLEELTPFLTGGETVEDVTYEACRLSPVPERFEAGLQNYAGAIGSAAAVRYLEELGDENVRQHELQLNQQLTRQLASFPQVKILGPQDPAARGSIVNFTVDDFDSGELSILLDKTRGIMTRSGVHCCHAWFHKYSLRPSLRVSLSVYNTAEEVEAFGDTLRKILRHFAPAR
jgi:cysteine desulfurase / selenocysteine lyase